MSYEVRLSREAKADMSELPDWQRDEMERLVARLTERPAAKGKAVRGEKGRRVISRGGYRAVYQIRSDRRQVDVLAITTPLASVVGDKLSVWELPKFKAMRKRPAGAPIDLTRDEAVAIVQEAFASRPDLPPGDEYVRQLRPVWSGLARHAPRKRSLRSNSGRE